MQSCIIERRNSWNFIKKVTKGKLIQNFIIFWSQFVKLTKNHTCPSSQWVFNIHSFTFGNDHFVKLMKIDALFKSAASRFTAEHYVVIVLIHHEGIPSNTSSTISGLISDLFGQKMKVREMISLVLLSCFRYFFVNLSSCK